MNDVCIEKFWKLPGKFLKSATTTTTKAKNIQSENFQKPMLPFLIISRKGAILI